MLAEPDQRIVAARHCAVAVPLPVVAAVVASAAAFLGFAFLGFAGLLP